MKRFNLQLFWAFAVLLLISCQVFQIRHRNSDPFYSNYSDWDIIRFPLIKPYQAEKMDDEHGWSINLPVSPYENGIPYYLDIAHAEKVDVENNVIMVYTSYYNENALNFGGKVLYWFVMLPDEKRETGFDNESDFLSFIQEYGIAKPNWLDMDSAFQQFYETGCLEWIPDCN